MPSLLPRKSKKGFTLIETGISLGIVAALVVAVALVMNPAEISRTSRDHQRSTELKTLDSALQYAQQAGSLPGNNKTVYVSIPDSSPTCGNVPSLPALGGGWVYACASSANYQKTDGTGWLPLSASSLPVTFSELPVDPINAVTAAGEHYYMYLKDGRTYELATVFESQKSTFEIAAKDGGTDDTRLELGPTFSLLTDSGAGTATVPIALVSAWSTYTGASPQSRNFEGPNTAGNLIVVGIQQYGDLVPGTAAPNPLVSDSRGNAYIKILGPVTSDGQGTVSWLYYAKNIAAGANTVTVTGVVGLSDLGFHIAEFSGLDTLSPLDKSASASHSGDDQPTYNWSTPSVATTRNKELLVAFGGNESVSGNSSPGAGFTDLSEQMSHQSAAEYRVVSSAGTYNATMTGPTDTHWNLILATFK